MTETGHDEAEVQVRTMVESILAGMGLELVELSIQGKARPRICIFLDGPDGVTVDQCARVSRGLSELLDAEEDQGEDVEGLFLGPYRLEVSSPGLDRLFENADDYRRNLTRRIHVQYLEAKPGGVEHVEGVLDSLDDSGFELRLDDGQLIPCRFDEVRKVHRSIGFKNLEN